MFNYDVNTLAFEEKKKWKYLSGACLLSFNKSLYLAAGFQNLCVRYDTESYCLSHHHVYGGPVIIEGKIFLLGDGNNGSDVIEE